MLTSKRGLFAATIFAGLCLSAAPALAETAEYNSVELDRANELVPIGDGSFLGEGNAFTVSGNVTLATQYRFRGVAMTGGDPAIQGGIDVVHSSGFYVGAWGSSLEGGAAYGELEMNFYGGWNGDISDAWSIDIGILQYNYPTDGGLIDPTDENSYVNDFNSNYWEPYASISTTLGPLEATFGAAYAWKQSSLGGDDNLWLYTDLGVGIPDSPISLNAHLGYTDGVLAPPMIAGTNDDTGFDWAVGASLTLLGGLDLGVSYIGVEGPSINDFTDDALVASLSVSF